MKLAGVRTPCGVYPDLKVRAAGAAALGCLSRSFLRQFFRIFEFKFKFEFKLNSKFNEVLSVCLKASLPRGLEPEVLRAHHRTDHSARARIRGEARKETNYCFLFYYK